MGHITHTQKIGHSRATPSASKIYEERLLDTLQQLKLWISDNADEADDFVLEL